MRIEELEEELAKVRGEFEAEREARRELLRKSPEVQKLYGMLLVLFGNSGAQPTPGTEPNISGGINAAKIEAWKKRFTGKCSDMIDVLTTYPDGITRTQWGALTGQAGGAFSQNIWKLNSAGLIEKIGDKYRLKI